MNKSTEKLTKSEQIIRRLKEGLGLKTDKSLCERLEIGTTTLAGWKSRDSVVYETIFRKSEDLSIHWLVTGEGPMRLDPTSEGGYNPGTRNAVGDEPMSDNERNLYERIFALQSENADLKIRLARMEAELQGKSERQGRRDVG